MNIILIGFMGCGKSTLGIRLSYRMKQPYIDTDKQIEHQEGRSIQEIFDTDGEAYFRSVETGVIEAFIRDGLKDHVISTGGGMPVTKDNIPLLKRLGVVAWLKCKPETVLMRLADDRTRPLLQGDDKADRVRELMEFREPFYRECADVTVEVDNKPIERIMDEIFTKSKGVWKRKKRMRYEQDTYN